MLTSANEIASMATSYFCTASLLHVSINVRETMWWWLAVARKKMWWCIASFGDSYHDDVLQFAKQLFSVRLPWMFKYCVMREGDNIYSRISLSGDLAFSHQDGIYGFKFPKRFLEISSSDLTLFSLLLNWSILRAQPLESMPFPFAFVWLNALQAVRHSNNHTIVGGHCFCQCPSPEHCLLHPHGEK